MGGLDHPVSCIMTQFSHYFDSGDSYSQTSSFPQPAPTEDEPLGVPFPGVTYTEGPPNWVPTINLSCSNLSVNIDRSDT